MDQPCGPTLLSLAIASEMMCVCRGEVTCNVVEVRAIVADTTKSLSVCNASLRSSWNGRKGVTSDCWSAGAEAFPFALGLEAADPSAADALIEVAAGVRERLWVSDRLWWV